MTGLFAFVLSTDVIVLTSAALLSYPVGAITIYSPCCQSTDLIIVIEVAPISAV